MSLLIEREIICPNCQFPNEAELWSAINVKEDPELKDLLLGGEINIIECDACHENFYAEDFLLYHDSGAELMAFVYPRSFSGEREKWEEKTRSDFEESQNLADEESRVSYAPLTLFGLDELVAIVEWDEEAAIQSEIAKVLSEQQGFRYYRLSPSAARRQRFPLVLPYKNGEASPNLRGAILKGMEWLTSVNDRLSIYAEARRRLLENPGLEVSLH